MTIMLKWTVAKWANAFMISWAHTKEMVANASGRAESFTPVSLVEYACQVLSLYLLRFKSYSEG